MPSRQCAVSVYANNLIDPGIKLGSRAVHCSWALCAPSLIMTFDLLPRPLHWPGRGPPVKVGLAPPRKMCVVVVGDVIVCHLLLTRLCCIVCGLPVVGQNLLENGPP